MNKFLFVVSLIIFAIASFAITSWWLRAPTVHMMPAFEKKDHLLFKASGGHSHLLKSGWSKAEGWGVWTIGKDAILTLPLDKDPVRKLGMRFKVQAFLHGQHMLQTVDIYLENRRLDTWVFNIKKPTKEFSLLLSRSDLANKKEVDLRFHIREPRSPKQLQMGQDDRLLGMGLLSVDLVAHVEKSVYVQE